MPQLTSEQQAKVEAWASEGATLNQIQDRLKTEFGISLTYMEARLLLLETNVKIKDKPREAAAAAAAAPQPAQEPPLDADAGEEDWQPGAAEADGQPEASSPEGGGKLSMSLDQIAIPGAMVSGKVTFSDGQAAAWYLDQMGRLGLANVPPTYQPPKADIPLFQQQLERILAQSGF
jgi:hypothetical protein